MFRAGQTLEEIMSRRGLVLGTLYGHLTAAVEAGEAIELSRLLSVEDQARLASAFANCGLGNITGVHQTHDGKFDFGLLRIYRAMQGRVVS